MPSQSSYIEYTNPSSEDFSFTEMHMEFIHPYDIKAAGLSNSGVWTELEVKKVTTTEVNGVKRTTFKIPYYNTYSNSVIRVYRQTTYQPLVDFQSGAILSERDLDTAYRQSLFAAQEVRDNAVGTLTAKGDKGDDGENGTDGETITINTSGNNKVITGDDEDNVLNAQNNLTYDGSTLINVQDAGATSEIKSSAGSVYTKVIADDASGFSAIDYSHDLRFKYAGTEKMRIKQYDFCFGTTSPIGTNGVTFKVGTTAGDDWISSYRTTASTPHYIHAFYSDAGGTQTAKYAVYADGTASAISDVNYKKNITDARNYLEDLEKIDVIKYNLKTDNEGEFKKLGFSAQQVETIFPNMIDADNTPLKEFYEEGDEIPDGKKIGDIKNTTAREVKLLKKEVFVPMLVKAVQELSAKIKTLETENTDIKARLTALEANA